MRNIAVADVDSIDRAVLAIGTDYPVSHPLPAHRHRRAQVLYAATGVMRVDTAHGSWTVPTQRAALIPPEVEHAVLMAGVSTRSLYLEPGAVPWFPARCQVVEVSALLRELLLAAVDMPAEYARRGRDACLADLLLYELRNLTPLPFELPLPLGPELRGLCEQFQLAPTIRSTPEDWALRMRISTRTFNRVFRTETGMTFQRWRQRACVAHALRAVATGETVTAVAAHLGYDTPAAFSVMFQRETGSPPSAFRPRDARIR
ncbi:helix-turn-helix transcriptional regulator [Nocardia sp. NPDC005978]|uniref:AraC family transcriptional regulator n=1 Tax=Nocardia sp. NPDC005978 TaxID=3156725 RepID=UPI0033AEF248